MPSITHQLPREGYRSFVPDLFGSTNIPSPIGPLRVLCIEDSVEHFEWISNMLEEAADPEGEGIDLFWAPSVTDGIPLLTEGALDVVLLDLGLPDLKGPRSIRAIRLIAPRLPVVVLTGDESGDSVVSAHLDGCASYLVKRKVNAEQLRETLWRAYLQQRISERIAKTSAMLEGLSYDLGDLF